MVRPAEPSKLSDTRLVHSRKRAKASASISSGKACISFQAPFTPSQVSGVRAVRTARPLARAVSRQDRMEDGLS